MKPPPDTWMTKLLKSGSLNTGSMTGWQQRSLLFSLRKSLARTLQRTDDITWLNHVALLLDRNNGDEAIRSCLLRLMTLAAASDTAITILLKDRAARLLYNDALVAEPEFAIAVMHFAVRTNDTRAKNLLSRLAKGKDAGRYHEDVRRFAQEAVVQMGCLG